jgi:hypothetical protein
MIMNDSMWNGKGTDPWLPHRIANLAEIAKAERGVYELIWAELSRWLVEVSRRVLATITPDPHAIPATERQWREAVNRIVIGPIRDAIGLSYKILLGEGYDFDSRPAVIEHLASVTNRMVRTPDSVFDLVAGQVAEGSELGESIPKIAARIDEVLSTTSTERWPNRAVVVARTETLGALNAGRDDSYTAVAEELQKDGEDIEFERMWLATDDTRTRETHRKADGQRTTIGGFFTVGEALLRRPCDPMGPAEEIIQCRCGILLLEKGETVDLSNRQFKNY